MNPVIPQDMIDVAAATVDESLQVWGVGRFSSTEMCADIAEEALRAGVKLLFEKYLPSSIVTTIH